ARFDGALFPANAWFQGATFSVLSLFGPLVCAGQIDLSGAVFEKPVTMEIAAREVRCERARWESTATLRLRCMTVDLSDAVLSSPVAVTAHSAPFTSRSGTTVDESPLAGTDCGVRVISLRGVDAAQLVLTDTDLTDCRFIGAFHLDRLRLEGSCTFASPPEGWRWTRRRVLAEEHHWRASVTTNAPPPPRGWQPAPNQAPIPDPDEVASVYRGLRKATEDAKNEPDAADFYYGEMEMRRHDCDRPWGERALLGLYWAVSGYGLRASRALIGLLVTMWLTVVLLILVGLPSQPRVQKTAGTLTTSGTVSLTTRGAVPSGEAPDQWADRFGWWRAERAARTAVNSVIFRSAGQGLTVPGTYIEMTSRLVEPVLLALALLAVRGRIKR
ncbi:pentapeptide repeat-containing protein, partial [Streptomyces pilosus]|uniref:pentapeptide repeat-containing protein n=1 Tax=Streptomyces pilosus TaxID=28893 RepID=UPI00363490BD